MIDSLQNERKSDRVGTLDFFMNAFSLSPTETLEALGTHMDSGLSESQAQEILAKNGKNELPTKPPKSVIAMFVSQLNDWLIYILFGAVLLTIWHHEYIDAAIILAVIFINAILGVIQEYKAGKAVEALKNMTSPHALVRRDGKTLEIPSNEVVKGDILLLDAGRIIAADVRLLESQELQIEESALTGESVPAKKDANAIFGDNEKTTIGDRKNMAFMSTVVTNGRGV